MQSDPAPVLVASRLDQGIFVQSTGTDSSDSLTVLIVGRQRRSHAVAVTQVGKECKSPATVRSSTSATDQGVDSIYRTILRVSAFAAHLHYKSEIQESNPEKEAAS